MTREQRKQLHDSRSGPGRHRHRALFITHASSNTSRRLRRTEGYVRTAAMVRADYTARAELHIRSNAASRSLTQTHTQHTTRPKRKKRDAKQNCSAAQCTLTDPRACHVRAGGTSHGIGRLVCGVCRHAAHTTRAAPPSPHKLFFIRCTSPPPFR